MWGLKRWSEPGGVPLGRGPWFLASAARGIVQLGVLLVIFGLGTTVYVLLTAQRGVETLATIETAQYQTGGFASPGVLDLSWRDSLGTQRTEYGVKISPQLARKLRIGRQLTRSMIRIRYQPGGDGGVTVIEDVPERFNGAAMIALVGFSGISLGSLMMLVSMLWDGARTKTRAIVRPEQSGATP